MKKSMRKFLLIILVFIFVLFFFKTVSIAGEMIRTDRYHTTLQYEEADYILKKATRVIKILRNIAIIISVVALSVIGVRYMVGSVEQKSEYKQTLLPVAIGCGLIISLSAILTAIQSIF